MRLFVVLFVFALLSVPSNAMLKKKNAMKNLRKMKIAGHAIGAIEKLKKLVASHPPGDKEVIDPSTAQAKATAQLAIHALNKARKINGLTSLSMKTLVSYQTQLVAGTLHIFCIETAEEGCVQLSWDEAVFGEPHLSSVAPLNKIYSWAEQTDATAAPPKFTCSVMPLPTDPRAPEDQGTDATTSFRFRESATTASSMLLEEEAFAKVRSLPKSWDARTDHKRGAECTELINKAHNQGTCGSCYAFAALGTASIRACLAGHDIKSKWFSVQDVLNCGSVREGEFQNSVIDKAKGTLFAGNCGGHWAGNVFEYATKYGLVEPSCQRYAHNGDPLTHFDKGAGAEECTLRNKGTSAIIPEVDVFVPPAQGYVSLLENLHRVVFDDAKPAPTPAESKELKRILLATNGGDSFKDSNDDEILSIFRQESNKNIFEKKLTPPSPTLVKMKLHQPIQPGETVSVDNMRWCKVHPSNTKNMDDIESETASSAHCMAKKNEGDLMTVSCKTNADVRVALKGPKGMTMGGLDKRICECAESQREYFRGEVLYKLPEKEMKFKFPNGEGRVELIELGNHARGICKRETDGSFGEAHKVEGCTPLDVFHSPVTVRANTQSEHVMMEAIQDGGAIAVSFATAPSFMHFDGEGVWNLEKDEKLAGGHAILFFGWGEESDGTKFWWGKNSWGKTWPKNKGEGVFKFARGNDVASIESRGASWVSVNAPGVPNVKSLKLTDKANGFCPDHMLHESLLADPSKVEESCVSLSCDDNAKPCSITFKSTCPKEKTETTVVDVVADANYGPIGYTGGDHDQQVNLGAITACISNVYVEDRSRSLLSSRTKTDDKKDTSVGSAIDKQRKEMRKEMQKQLKRL